ncbi:MAG: four helix bundle protein [Phycisphaerae bacterium]|nr:four helix bundle protein [Phycisphaerae bacterium]
MGAKRFEDLKVWQAARELTRGVYRAADTQQLGKDWALANQMKRAAVSIGSNIAEGFERGTRKQQIEACYTAKGSAGELRSQVITASDVGLIDKRAYEWLLERCESCSRQLQAYIAHLRRTRDGCPGPKYLEPSGDGTKGAGDEWA